MRELIFDTFPKYLSYDWLLREKWNGHQTHVLVHRPYTPILTIRSTELDEMESLPKWIIAA